MLAHANEEAPDACCGILAVKDGSVTGYYRIENVKHSPYHYELEYKSYVKASIQIEDAGEVAAFYSSRNHSIAYPSQTDIRLALPGFCYVLVSPREFDQAQRLVSETPQVRAFFIEDGAVIEETITDARGDRHANIHKVALSRSPQTTSHPIIPRLLRNAANLVFRGYWRRGIAANSGSRKRKH